MCSQPSRIFLVSTLLYVGAAQAAAGDELTPAPGGTRYLSEVTGYPGPNGPRFGTGYEARHGLGGGMPGGRAERVERAAPVERPERVEPIERIERGRGH